MGLKRVNKSGNYAQKIISINRQHPQRTRLKLLKTSPQKTSEIPVLRRKSKYYLLDFG